MVDTFVEEQTARTTTVCVCSSGVWWLLQCMFSFRSLPHCLDERCKKSKVSLACVLSVSVFDLPLFKFEMPLCECKPRTCGQAA